MSITGLCPIIILAYNNYSYVKNMVFNLERYVNINEIYIVDNCSTYPKLLEYYSIFKNLIRLDKNYGPHGAIAQIRSRLPSIYIITDPDLEINPKLPKDFIQQLIKISDTYKARKVGFALDISQPEKFQETGKTFKGIPYPYEWEKQFWLNKIPNPNYELYNAEIDTTFCLYSTKYPYGNIRVAGDFTCLHLPWYKSSTVSMTDEELDFYKKNNIGSTWFK